MRLKDCWPNWSCASRKGRRNFRRPTSCSRPRTRRLAQNFYNVFSLEEKAVKGYPLTAYEGCYQLIINSSQTLRTSGLLTQVLRDSVALPQQPIWGLGHMQSLLLLLSQGFCLLSRQVLSGRMSGRRSPAGRSFQRRPDVPCSKMELGPYPKDIGMLPECVLK